jgi:hypothetical protein
MQVPDPLFASYTGLETQGGPSLPLTKFLLERWTPFQIKWNAYRDQTFHEPTVFDTLRTEFATLRSDWTGPMGQTTRAKVPERAPSGLSLEGMPWGWIALGVGVVALPFIIPTVAGLYLAVTKGKSIMPMLKAAA